MGEAVLPGGAHRHGSCAASLRSRGNAMVCAVPTGRRRADHAARSAPLAQIERATLSVVVSSLVRKGLIEQVADHTDQRQIRLRLTDAGTTLWNELPDLSFIHTAAFEGIDDDELAIAVQVLRTATERLDHLAGKGTNA